MFATFENNTIPAPTDNLWGGFDNYIVPLDSFIDIDLEYSVIDTTSGTDDGIKLLGQVMGSENTVMVPPQKGLLPQVKHIMEIKKLKIKYWDPGIGAGAWAPYEPYESVPNIKLIPEVISELAFNSNFLQTLPLANWQLSEPGKNSKIRVLALNPLSHFSKCL